LTASVPLETFLQQLRCNPEQIEYDTTLTVIDGLYDFTPVSFQNGDQFNMTGQNNGSCKIFAFARLHRLTEQETLACFGRYYREDVLLNPDAGTHPNIRNFMESGWAGILFRGAALVPRAN
jgi:hypothetical protein